MVNVRCSPSWSGGSVILSMMVHRALGKGHAVYVNVRYEVWFRTSRGWMADMCYGEVIIGTSREGSMTGQYDRDFYAWTLEQAALLRAGDLNAADIEHIAEEIESLG